MFKKIISAAVVALAMTFASSSAQAAPQFLTPDVNFASHGDALFFNDSHNYSVSINTAVGDSMVIDNGTGFTPLSNATLGVSLEGGLGGFGLTIGSTDFVTGSLVSTTVNNNILGGKDIFAVFKITTSSVSGFVVGQLAGFDVLSFNMHDLGNGTSAGMVKGDLAPVVPEPATLSLVILGLGGLATTARRRLA